MKIRRIIVGIEPEQRQRAVLEAAARLASRMEAELVALFVENTDLIHFASLPFAREFGLATATRREIDVAAMERSLRALAGESRRMVETIAGQVPVRWSFRVARGCGAVELLADAGDADLVVANIERPEEAGRAVRLVRAGDPGALRAAVAEGGGVLVLAGSDPVAVGETLRQLMQEAGT